VQVIEVRSCFLSEAWWLLFVPPALTCIHCFFLHVVSVFCIILTIKDFREHPQPVGPCNVGALFSVTQELSFRYFLAKFYTQNG
jgi:hypothetical protein